MTSSEVFLFEKKFFVIIFASFSSHVYGKSEVYKLFLTLRKDAYHIFFYPASHA